MLHGLGAARYLLIVDGCSRFCLQLSKATLILCPLMHHKALNHRHPSLAQIIHELLGSVGEERVSKRLVHQESDWELAVRRELM